MVDIFDEVDEELRAERARVLLRRYGALIIAGALMVVAGAAAWQSWRWWEDRRDAEAAVSYFAAMSTIEHARTGGNEPLDQAAQAFARAARDAPASYAVISRLRAAALLADRKEFAEAGAIWNEVASNEAADPILRDLASLSFVQRQLDSADTALLEARLKPLGESGGVWRALALETQALLQIRAGQIRSAREILGQLARDPTAPDGVRERAGGLLIRFQG